MFRFYGFNYEEIENIQNKMIFLIECSGEDGCTFEHLQEHLFDFCDKDFHFMETLLEELEIEQKIEQKDDKYYYTGG